MGGVYHEVVGTEWERLERRGGNEAYDGWTAGLVDVMLDVGDVQEGREVAETSDVKVISGERSIERKK
jgi:hypothetical protein